MRKRDRIGRRIDGYLPEQKPSVWFAPLEDEIPDEGELGQTFVNTSNYLLYVHNGTAFVPVGYISDGSVTTAKLATGAVTNVKLASNAVETAKILDANVTNAKLAASAVGTSNIIDANVTNAKLAANAVGTSNIIDANVTNAKLATNSVDTSNIISNSITLAKIDTAVYTSTGAGDPSNKFVQYDGFGEIHLPNATIGQISCTSDLAFSSGAAVHGPANVTGLTSLETADLVATGITTLADGECILPKETTIGSMGATQGSFMFEKVSATPGAQSLQPRFYDGTAWRYTKPRYGNFDGTVGSPTVGSGSYGITSITKTGTGNYVVNILDYGTIASATASANDALNCQVTIVSNTQVRIQFFTGWGGSAVDCKVNFIIWV